MSDPVSVGSAGPEATRAIAAALGERSAPGDLYVLVGDLGSGKTAFAQGLGAGLGVTEPITSPTFALVQSYSGRTDFHHLDVYRLEQLNEALDLGLSEMFDDDAVVAIEWGDAIAPVLPHDYLEVRLAYGDGESERTISFTPVGRRWAGRMGGVAAVVTTAAERAC